MRSKPSSEKFHAEWLGKEIIITARSIEASFGSINRYYSTLFSVQPKGTGVLCVADVTYSPSIPFWIFFVLGLLVYDLLFWIPIVFYLVQKRTVRSEITYVFTRVKNEFEIEERSAPGGELDALEKLWALKGTGILTEAEFESKKQEILVRGSQSTVAPTRRAMTEGAKCGNCAAPILTPSKILHPLWAGIGALIFDAKHRGVACHFRH